MKRRCAKFVGKFEETIKQPQMYMVVAVGVLLSVVMNGGVRTDLASTTIYSLALLSIVGTIMKMYED